MKCFKTLHVKIVLLTIDLVITFTLCLQLYPISPIKLKIYESVTGVLTIFINTPLFIIIGILPVHSKRFN